MGNNRPVKTKDFIKFLEAHNCRKVGEKASHSHYKCPKCLRRITIREAYKEIPPLHLRTNLKTMEKTVQYLYEWIKNN